MSRGAWVAAIAVGIVVLVVGGVVLATSGDGSGHEARPKGPVARALADAQPAGEPFADLSATTVGVGGRRLDVVLADESQERFQGLRERSDIGPHDGMLFVFDAPTTTAFTMSTVPVPLAIGFYDADGRVVDRLLMKPCPRAQDRCPLYRASGPFTYALETLKGDLPEGDLSA